MSTPEDAPARPRSPAASSTSSALQLDVGEPLTAQLVSLTVQAASTTAFPTVETGNDALGSRLQESPNSSRLTDRDKLTALPTASSIAQRPVLARGRSGSVPSRFESLPNSTHSPGRSTASDPQQAHGDGTSTPPHRVSFDRDPNHTLPHLFKNTFGRFGTHTSSDPVLPTHRGTVPATPPPPPRQRTDSASHRTASPLRFWGGLPSLHRPHSRPEREEPFVPKDPYAVGFSTSAMRKRRERLKDFWDELMRVAYLHLLLRLPSVYFSRVSRVFEDAEVSRPDIERLIERVRLAEGRATASFPSPREWTAGVDAGVVSPALGRFKDNWEEFVDSLMREWKTLNLVSALLLSAIVTIFQIEDAANDPTTRTTAFISMAAALFSLIYGCIFILRFGTMRRMEKASRWAEEAQRTTTNIWWNVWVLLATPAIWLAWSVIFFCASMLAFLWTSGTNDPPQPLPPGDALIPRIIVTVVFALGGLYFILVVRTFRSYGLSRPGGREIRPSIDRHSIGHALQQLHTRDSTAAGAPPPPRATDGITTPPSKAEPRFGSP